MFSQSPILISTQENFSSCRPLSDAPRGVKETANTHSNAISAILEISENNSTPFTFTITWAKVISFFSQ